MASTIDVLTVTGNCTVNGVLNPAGGLAAGVNTRTSMTQETGKEYYLPIELARRHDHPMLPLPETAADDDFGVAAGTFGSDSMILQTADKKSAGATSVYARWSFQFPVEYVTGQAASIKCRAFMSVAADTTAVLDWEAYIVDGEGGVVGSDIVTGTATDINSTTPADVTLTLDATSLLPGVWIELRLAATITDGAGANPVIAYVGKPRLLLSVKG